jgi:hypothetical protein
MRAYEYIEMCKRQDELSHLIIGAIVDVYDIEEIDMLKELFQQVYDTKIADMASLKESIKAISNPYRIMFALFLWSIFADRLDHYLENFLPLREDRKNSILSEILGSINIRTYRRLKDRFTLKFLDCQLDILQERTSLFLLNREINSLTDIFLKVYCDKRFDSDSSTFQSFINNAVHGSIFRELVLTQLDVQLINNLYLGTKGNLHIDIDVINKFKISDIQDVLDLGKYYRISDITLTKNAVSKFTSETLDKYMNRIQEESSVGFRTHTTSKIIEFIEPEVLTDELVKKYYTKFFSDARSVFVERILMPRYSLKDMIKLLEGCA